LDGGQASAVVIVDGGFRTGGDVQKDLAFEVSLVGLGRLGVYGLAARRRGGVTVLTISEKNLMKIGQPNEDA
jgi:isopentenyl diphosphate isomerase/L-lactate dehydrogenase-like FMN-dependent dehydrogenase